MSEALRKAAEQALAMLGGIDPVNMTPTAQGAWVRASQTLYAALAEPTVKPDLTVQEPEQAEPVAWVLTSNYLIDGQAEVRLVFKKPEGDGVWYASAMPLFVASPPRREPLTVRRQNELLKDS